MGRSLLGAGLGDLLPRSGPERAARCGDDRLLHIPIPAGGESLVQGVVLRVDWHELDAEAARIRHEGSPGTDEALLVGESDPPAWLQSRMGRLQTGRSADGGQNRIGI